MHIAVVAKQWTHTMNSVDLMWTPMLKLFRFFFFFCSHNPALCGGAGADNGGSADDDECGAH